MTSEVKAHLAELEKQGAHIIIGVESNRNVNLCRSRTD
jgi:hypothetical protein